jgi:hypothetical protein
MRGRLVGAKGRNQQSGIFIHFPGFYKNHSFDEKRSGFRAKRSAKPTALSFRFFTRLILTDFRVFEFDDPSENSTALAGH